MESFKQIVLSAPARTLINGKTFTVMVSLLMHPLLLMLTVYWVVAFGYTTTLAVFVLLIFWLGSQLKIPLLFTLMGKLSMLQINVSLKGTCNKGLSETASFLVSV